MLIAGTLRCRAQHSIDSKLIGAHEILIDVMSVHPHGLVFRFLNLVTEFPSCILGSASSAE